MEDHFALVPSSNHSSLVQTVEKRVVIQKCMQFSSMSCSYTAQCLGRQLHETDSPEAPPPACGIIPQYQELRLYFEARASPL